MRDESQTQYPMPWVGPSGLALQQNGFRPEQDGDEGLNLRRLFTVIFKHKLKIGLAFLATAIVASGIMTAYTYFLFEPTFEARGLLLVKFGWENVSPDLSLNEKRAPVGNPGEIVSSEVRILQSRELKERMVSSLKAETLFPDLAENPPKQITPVQAALLRIEKNLAVTPAQRGNVIEVAYRDASPVRAAMIVNQIVSLYIDRRSEVYKDPKSILFLEKKTEEYRQKLVEAENKLKAFRNEAKIISYDEQRTALLNQKMAISSSLGATGNEIKQIEQKIAELEKQLQILPKNAPASQAGDRADSTENRLLAMQLQEKELLSKYKEDTRMVQNVREQIAMVKEHMAKQRAPGAAPVDPMYQDVQKQIIQAKADLSALKVKSTALEQQLKDSIGELQAFESQESKNKELIRESTNLEEKYKSYRQRLEETRIYDELDRQKMTSVSVIETAGAPIAPVNPLKPLPVLIAAILALALLFALGLAFVIEVISPGMLTPADAEKRLNLPVLATVAYK